MQVSVPFRVWSHNFKEQTDFLRAMNNLGIKAKWDKGIAVW